MVSYDLDSDSDEEEYDEEAAEPVDDGTFEEMWKLQKNGGSIGYHHRALINFEILTSKSCLNGATFECGCQPGCGVTCSATQQDVYNLRQRVHSKNSHNGDRIREVASVLSASHTNELTSHPTESSSKKVKRRHHFTFNNFSVCRPWWKQAACLLEATVKRALAMNTRGLSHAYALAPNEARGLAAEEEAAKESVNRLHVVKWFEAYAKLSHAEKIPSGDAVGVLSAISNLEDGEEIDSMCQYRLHESEITQLYTLYSAETHLVFDIIDKASFGEIFKSDTALRHIKLSRCRDSFGECNTCSEFKTKLCNRRLHPAERSTTKHYFSIHLKWVRNERQAYVSRAGEVKVLHPPGSKPSIEGAVSIIFDKMTGRTTQCPLIIPMPKCLNPGARLNVHMTGVIVHGVGRTYYASLDSQSKGCNLSIEVVDRQLRYLSDHFTLPGVLYLQADNHTDCKTPAMLFYVGNLLRQGKFRQARLGYLYPGHGHTDVDQVHSVTARQIRRKGAYPLSRSRLFKAFIDAFIQDKNKPRMEEVNFVRDWASAFSGTMESVDLARLAVSNGSGEAQYCYLFELDDKGEVVMFYQQSPANQPAVYPRSHNPGDIYICETHGVGAVTATEYSDSDLTWKTTVVFSDQSEEVYSLKPLGIKLFPGAVPEIPLPEVMSPDWPGKLTAIERNLNSCYEKLSIFADIDGVKDDWKLFFESSKAAIELSKADPTGPYCREPVSPDWVRDGPLELPPPLPVPPAQYTPVPPFTIDPVTHTGFTEQHRRRLQQQMRAPQNLSSGDGIVLLRLQFGSAVPVTHVLPFCLAMVLDSLEGSSAAAVSNAGTLVSFAPFFTQATDLAGTWTPSNHHPSMKAPLSTILVSGLSFISTGRLEVASQRRVSELVSRFDLGTAAPPVVGTGGV